MIIIYLYHTEGRFGLNNEFIHALFFPFYVNSFFFISGYLLFRKNARDDLKDLDSLSWFYKSGKQMFLNIVFRIVIPTIIFSALFYFPKFILRETDFSLSSFAHATICGGSFWFASALTVAEVLFFIIFLFKRNSLIIICITVLMIVFMGLSMPIEKEGGYLWEWQKGFVAVAYLFAGGLFYTFERRDVEVDVFKRRYIIASFLLLLVSIIAYINVIGILKKFIYIFIGTSTIIILKYICELIPSHKIYPFVASSTLGLYFFSGGIPEVLYVVLFSKINMPNIFAIFLDAIISFFLSLLIVKILENRTPWLFDLRNIKSL